MSKKFKAGEIIFPGDKVFISKKDGRAYPKVDSDEQQRRINLWERLKKEDKDVKKS